MDDLSTNSPDPVDPVRRMLDAGRVAVVGLSDRPDRASHAVATYLRRAGKTILPVNPTISTWQGLAAYRSLAEVPGPIDLVNVFRRSEGTPQIARDAVAAGAKGLWLQIGITHVEARRVAEAAGLDYVENLCLMVEHRRRSV